MFSSIASDINSELESTKSFICSLNGITLSVESSHSFWIVLKTVSYLDSVSAKEIITRTSSAWF